MESSKSTAYAFMIMLAGLAVIGYLGRASAEVATPHGESIAPAQGMMGGYQPQYGLIQTGMVGVAQLEATGTFGRPAPMPVFQVIQLQPTGYAQRQASLDAAPGMSPQMQPQATEPSVPQGMSVTPPSAPQMTATLCDIKGVHALTQSADACATAGGQPVTQ